MERNPDDHRFSRFRRTSMDRIVGDRDIMMRQAEARAEAAEATIEDLQAQLEELRAGAARSAEEIDGLRAQLETARAQAGVGEASSQVGAEVRRILEAAEQTAAEMVEHAEADAAARRRGAEELWASVQAQVARMAEWRAKVEPRMESMRTRLQGIERAVGEVPGRLEEALQPLAEALRAGAEELANADADTHPPLLVAPGSEERDEEAEERAPKRSALDRGDEPNQHGLGF